MDRKAIEFFLDKTVKLVQDNNFVQTGVIEELFDDSLFFKTERVTALISFSKITEIVLINGA